MSAQEVRRFPREFVVQHSLLIFTFTILAITGFPLKWEWWGVVNVMGGYKVVKFIHNNAGLIMIIQGIFHVVHAVGRQLESKSLGGLWPAKRDVSDMVHDSKYLLGLVPSRARYPRYSYVNKFDYWGAFWGIAIMGGTGLVLWFPWTFSDVVIQVSHLAHTHEAVLAAGAIFVWHLYHVHTLNGKLRLNTVWLTGNIALEDLKREHPEEYEAMLACGELSTEA